MAIANYTRTCAKNTPGNSKFLITEIASITSFTVTSGEVTAVTANGAARFHEHQVKKHTVRRKAEESGTDGNITIKHTIEVVYNGLGKDLNTAKSAIRDALACGAYAIVLDANAQAWLCGYSVTNGSADSINIINAVEDSGIKASDEEMGTYSMTLEWESGYDDIPFDSTQSAAIAGETATTYCTFN